ncbi:dehydrogenase [Mycolicibacterium aubagnense]|uniref:Dehydrogenase n=1 Tax=Mycolicibacterium aubagnense TaxID=319707 RepID=A0ABN5Z019_9MYCO|nr:dehydrogenase [Mycolicibacterium aubagnense]BBX87513.1 dehydrogenase [Mycolicibacterium aubagnense]
MAVLPIAVALIWVVTTRHYHQVVDVTVVGSGPNGLAAAVVCARAGLSVRVIEGQPTPGGGARSAPDPEYPGILHDVCAAVHPLAFASPFFRDFGLADRITLNVPEVSYANPLPGRPAALAYRDFERTCAELADGASWRWLLGPMVQRSEAAAAFVLGDKRSLPPDLVTSARLALRMVTQGSPAWGLLRGEDARALFTGVAAHTISQMPSMTSSGLGMMLAVLAHSVGWPVPTGGSQAIPEALIADLLAHGGEVVVGEEVTEPPQGVVLYDTPAKALLDIYGDRLPTRYAARLRGLRTNPGVAKVDFVLSDEIPWRDSRLASTVMIHLGGERARMVLAEREIASGRHAEWPMVLAASPHIADPTRIDDHGRRPFWSYVHVPRDSPVDQTEAVIEIMERFAPGFRDIIVATRGVPASQLAEHNANLTGGDITGGGNSAWRALAGPTLRLNPWATPIPGAYLCSAATPPNGGVHGMAGLYAARTVLHREFGVKTLPSLAP